MRYLSCWRSCYNTRSACGVKVLPPKINTHLSIGVVVIGSLPLNRVFFDTYQLANPRLADRLGHWKCRLDLATCYWLYEVCYGSPPIERLFLHICIMVQLMYALKRDTVAECFNITLWSMNCLRYCRYRIKT